MRLWREARARGLLGELVPFLILGVMILTLVLLPIVTHYQVRTADIYNIFQSFAAYGLVALVLGTAIMAGEFDLSVPGVYLLAGMVAVLTGNGSPTLGVFAALGVGLIVGLIQGGVIAGFRLNSMPVTLGGYLILLGITYILGHSQSVSYPNYNVGIKLDQPIQQIFSIRSLVTIALFVVAAVLMRYTRFGRDIRAIGGDRRSARIAGVPVSRLVIGVFVIAAVGTALPGALLSYSLATAAPTNGLNVLTFAATAALLGGVSLAGGHGSPVGIAAGVLSLSILQAILSVMASPDYVVNLITGGLLIAVTIFWAPELSQWLKTAGVLRPPADDPPAALPVAKAGDTA